MLQRSTSIGDRPGHDVPRFSAASALQLLDRHVATGTDGALLIVGDPGLGKTHLLEQLAIRADLPLLRTHADEQRFSLSGLSALLGTLHPAMVHEFGRSLHVRQDDDAGLYAAAHDIRDLIVGLGLPPTVVLLDDVDLLDRQSSVILATLLPRLTGTNVRIVATATHPPRGYGALAQVRLAELSTAEAERLALDTFPDADATTLRVLMAFSSREPAVWLQTVDSLSGEQRAGRAPLKLPLHRDDDAVTMPFAVGEPEHALLLDVALSPLAHRAALATLHPDADAMIAELLDGGLLRSQGAYLAFGDQRWRSAMLHAAAKRERRERHALLADALPEEAAHLVAWHHSFLSTDPSVAPELFGAAVRAIEQGCLRAGVELAERAFTRWLSSSPCLPVVVELCWSLQRAGETALASRYGTWALATRGDPEHELRLAAVRMVGSLSTGERLFDAEDSALVTLHGAQHHSEAKQLEGLVAAAHLERWEPAAAREALARARSFGREPGTPGERLLTELGGIADAIEGLPRPTAPTAESAGLTVEELIVRARHLSLREHYADARWLVELALHHPAMRDRAWMALAHRTALLNEIAGGDFHAARRAIDAWSRDAPWIWRETSASTWTTAWRHYSLGELDEALALLGRCLDLAGREGTPAHQARALALRGAAQLMADDVDASLADLRDASVLSRDFAHPALLRHGGDYVEACVRADRLGEARRAVDTFAARMTRRTSPWGVLVLARSRALVAPLPESVHQLTALVRSLDEGELISYEGARTLRCLSAQQDVAGQPIDAQRTAATAATIFDSLGAVGWAAQTRLRAPRLGVAAGAPTPLEQLTDRDREIARLVLTGLRNREIAERLYLSVRTVELRLTQIYRQLGVASRVQLIALLGDDAA